ncbi:LysR family transcriptional regulator [Pseudomonas sp. NPDC090203]|uniref:LysR family transcriptional regulator n=1 Tax=Pseudomonas sp. NPDC090203 TaxID=3364477 RepID=UPI00382CF44D
MPRSSLQHININLLMIFNAVMSCRSVSLAAEHLSLGQPAVSSALGRLRALFDDPLFVRSGRFMKPTQRAIEIAELLGPALKSISLAVEPPPAFEPGTSDRVFHLGLNDDVEFALLPSLLKRIRNEAPGVSLIVRRASYLEMPRLLNAAEITVGVGYTAELPASTKRRMLRRTRIVLLRSDGLQPDLDLEQFCRRPHAMVSFTGNVVGFVDGALKRVGRERKVALVVPHFTSLEALLSDSDLVAAVPDYVAEIVEAGGKLKHQALPVPLAEFAVNMVWPMVCDKDPANRWLRKQIELVFGDQLSGGSRRIAIA